MPVPVRLKNFLRYSLKIYAPSKLDITSMESIEESIRFIERIDILINNAGYGLVSTVEDVTEEEMFNQFNVNVFGIMRVCKAVIPKMRRRRRVELSSISLPF